MEKELKKYIKKFDNVQESLIKILQEAQRLNSYLSDEIIEKISEYTKIPIPHIMGVATFYTQFRFSPVGKHIIRTCAGTACHVNGAQGIKNIILEYLDITEDEVTKDGFYSLDSVACIGCCSLAPVIMIDEETFGNLTPTSVLSYIKKFRKESIQK